MTDKNPSPDTVEQLFDRLSKTSERLTQATEEQVREFEQRTKDLVERAEAATERLMDALNRELRTQLAGLSREIERLMARVGEVGGRGPAKKSAARKSATKKSTAKKSTAKKSATKKSTAKKSTAKKSGYQEVDGEEDKQARRWVSSRNRCAGRVLWCSLRDHAAGVLGQPVTTVWSAPRVAADARTASSVRPCCIRSRSPRGGGL